MDRLSRPRVLFITPEITYLPQAMGEKAHDLSAKAGGLADVSAALISALYEQGSDIHVALPDYRALFNRFRDGPPERRDPGAASNLSPERIHLAKDCAFYYRNKIYAPPGPENTKTALAFQRDVINHIIPRVKPDLIHCNDWMTGLIPAAARIMNIPCLFTLHNIHTVTATLDEIEDRGIDAAVMWQHLYFHDYPQGYMECRHNNRVNFLTSGIFAAHFVNTVSRTFLDEIINGRHGQGIPGLCTELSNKWNQGCASGILNAPPPSFNPATDTALPAPYTPMRHVAAKKTNKRALQQMLGLSITDKGALFFWPSRLDSGQKGCALLQAILNDIVTDYRDQDLQIVIIADGASTQGFIDQIGRHGLGNQVSIRSFDEALQRIAYGAADFVLMPSAFEPCGLPQMIGAIYGALPIVHDTGGLHDTITHLDVDQGTGNGFVFTHHDAPGLRWAVDQAMAFHRLPGTVRYNQRRRIMSSSIRTFTHDATAREYIHLYETMLERPLL